MPRISFEGQWNSPSQQGLFMLERPDLEALRALVDGFDSLEMQAAFGGKNREEMETQRFGLQSYLRQAQANNGVVRVEYGRSKCIRTRGADVKFRGRLMPVMQPGCASVSLTTMKKEFRAMVSGARLVDIDMVNAHPSLLLSRVTSFADAGLLWITDEARAVDKARIRYTTKALPEVWRPLEPKRDLPVLHSYVHNRDKMLRQISSDRKVAKVAVLKTIYGGDANVPLLEDLAQELFGTLVDFIKAIDPALVKLAQEKDLEKGYVNSDGCILSYYAQSLENDALFYTQEFLASQGVQVEALCYDGLLARKSTLETVDLVELLVNCSRYVSRKMNFPIGDELHFECKPMKRSLDIHKLCAGEGVHVNDDEYVNPGTVYDALMKHRRVGIWAGLGVGKTTSICRVINRLAAEKGSLRVLFLSVRRVQARNFLPRLQGEAAAVPWISYMDSKALASLDPLESVGVICSFESLWKLSGYQFDLIVVDESESVACTAVSEATQKAHISQNHSTFEQVLRESRWVVGMDAYAGPNSRLLLGYENVLRWHHVRQKRSLVMTEVPWYKTSSVCDDTRAPYERRFVGKILEAVEKGRVYVFFSSKAQLNSVRLTLTRSKPDLKIAVYKGDEVSSKLLNVDEEWAGVDVVLATSTITVGVDCTLRFQKVLAWSSDRACVVRDIFQSLNRVRVVVDPVMEFYYLWDEGNRLGQMSVERYVRMSVEHVKFYTKYLEEHGEMLPLMKGAKEMFIAAMRERLNMHAHFVSEVSRVARLTYGTDCSVSLQKPGEKVDTDTVRDLIMERKTAQVPELSEMVCLTEFEFNRLRTATQSPERDLQMKHYVYCKTVPLKAWSQQSWSWWLSTTDSRYQARVWDTWPQWVQLPPGTLRARGTAVTKRDPIFLFEGMRDLLTILGVKEEEVYRGFQINRERLIKRLQEPQMKRMAPKLGICQSELRKRGKGSEFQRAKQFVVTAIRKVFGVELATGLKRVHRRVERKLTNVTPLTFRPHALGDAFELSWLTPEYISRSWELYEREFSAPEGVMIGQ